MRNVDTLKDHVVNKSWK